MSAALPIGQHVVTWQFLENDKKWVDLSNGISQTLTSLAIKGTTKYSHGKYSYTAQKTSVDEAIQSNDSTKNKRDLRRILVDGQSGQRVVWRYRNEHNRWVPMDTDVMLRLMPLAVNTSMTFKRGKWNYSIKKSSATTGVQTNLKTNTKRQCKLKWMAPDAMDSGRTPKGIECITISD